MLKIFHQPKIVCKNISSFFILGICLILAGEPTHEPQKDGRGGRAQDLALKFSIDTCGSSKNRHTRYVNMSLLSCATGGVDGTTNAAGAIGSNQLFDEAIKQGLQPRLYLKNKHSNIFFTKLKSGKYLIKTGPKDAGVMDIHILIIKKSLSSKPEYHIRKSNVIHHF